MVLHHLLVSQELGKLESLSLYPHLDLETWKQWREHLSHLHDCLSRALKQLETQASAANARSKQPSLFKNFAADRMKSTGIELRDPCASMNGKYADVDKALRGMQPYHPLSLSFYEPVNGVERFAWLQGLALSFPMALLKVHVGGTFGVLAWALRRDEDHMESDCQDVQEALRMIQPVVPKVHPAACVHGCHVF